MIPTNQSVFADFGNVAQENSVICHGLPSQNDLLKEAGFRFEIGRSECRAEIEKLDAKPTDSDEDMVNQQQFRVYFTLNNQSSQDQIQSNPDSSTSQNCIQDLHLEEIQVPNQPASLSEGSKKKKPKRNRKGSYRKRKQKCESGGETKNIPKNYGKQIIKFIKKQKKLTQQVLKEYGSKFSYEKLIQQLKIRKRTLNKIPDLKRLWIEHQYSKQVRVLSAIFLRKHCFQWIFNSRIEKVKYPIKYRYKIIEGVRNPQNFEQLKDY